MIEISRHRAGECENCGANPAEYSIRGGADEWKGLNRLCQVCMRNLLNASEVVRDVLLLQSGTRE